MGDGTLRYRARKIEEFIDQRDRLTQIRPQARVKWVQARLFPRRN